MYVYFMFLLLLGEGAAVENMEKGLFKLDIMLSTMFYSIFVMRLMNKA